MKGKNFFCKNKHHIGVVQVPSFHLSARSFSFFRAFFLHFCGEPFYGSPDTILRTIPYEMSHSSASVTCQRYLSISHEGERRTNNIEIILIGRFVDNDRRPHYPIPMAIYSFDFCLLSTHLPLLWTL